MKAQFLHGEPVMVDYTPGSDVSAGDVIVKNNSLYIAHSDIKSGVKGAVASGGGVYALDNGALGAAINNGNLVRWDGTNFVPIASGTSNLKFGPAVGGDYTTNDASLIALHVAGLNI